MAEHTSREITQRRAAGPSPTGRRSTTEADQDAPQALRHDLRDYVVSPPNNTGIPTPLKQGLEALSGVAMDDVRVHRHSTKPAKLNAHAYAQGSEIHLASGQDRHLPHEAWHVVQQKQGRVRPSWQLPSGVPINDDRALEREADIMGARARQLAATSNGDPTGRHSSEPAQGTTTYRTMPVQRLLKDGQKVDLDALSDAQLQQLCTDLHHGHSSYKLEAADEMAQILAYAQQRFNPNALAESLQGAIDEHLSQGSGQDHGSSSDEDYVPSDREMRIAHLTTTARFNAGLDNIRHDADGEEREIKPWPEKSLQGHLGEYMARQAMENRGAQSFDLNAAHHNFSGLDNLSDQQGMEFEQTKLHLSSSTSNSQVYLQHLESAAQYAIKGVRALKRWKAELTEAMQAQDFHPTANIRKALKATDDLDGMSDDDIEGTVAHEIVSGNMVFSIPSDIYKLIPNDVKHRFVDLGVATDELRATMTNMADDYTPAKPSGSKPKDEETEWQPGKK